MPADGLDTNVLVYLLVADASKAARAEAMLRARPIISVQVLNELANVARRKLNFAWPVIADFIERVRSNARVVPVTEATNRAGLRLAERYRLAIYDAMIVAAALEAGCATLWSEDMQDGLRVEDRLTVRNPFRATEGATA